MSLKILKASSGNEWSENKNNTHKIIISDTYCPSVSICKDIAVRGEVWLQRDWCAMNNVFKQL